MTNKEVDLNAKEKYMGRVYKKEEMKVPVEITFTDGYQKRFTEAILKIHVNRLKNARRGNDDILRSEVSQNGKG